MPEIKSCPLTSPCLFEWRNQGIFQRNLLQKLQRKTTWNHSVFLLDIIEGGAWNKVLSSNLSMSIWRNQGIFQRNLLQKLQRKTTWNHSVFLLDIIQGGAWNKVLPSNLSMSIWVKKPRHLPKKPSSKIAKKNHLEPQCFFARHYWGWCLK